MLVLGIESSCDETAASLVEDGKVRSSVVLSQERMHRPFRGIVPEVASRAHVEGINRIVSGALGSRAADLDAIAVTVGPGLVGSLLVGKMTAEALGWAWDKPVVGVNHLEAHLFANGLEHRGCAPPFLGLVVSGGHTDLVRVLDYGRYEVLGRTRDDAAGECYDKVANLLGLGYPGGPRVDRLARSGDPKAAPFPRPHMDGSWDFSFSGLKTAVLYHLRKHPLAALSRRDVRNICAGFQAAVVDVLVRKATRAALRCGLARVSVGGGVSANSALRARFQAEARKCGLKVFLPSLRFCTDNAAMVAFLGAQKLRKLGRLPGTLAVDPSLPIRDWE